MTENLKPSEIMKRLAELGWEGKIKGESLKRNSRLYPMNLIFDQIRKQNEVLDTKLIKDATSQQLFDHLERIADDDYKPGNTTFKKVTTFVDTFFKELLEGCYKNKLTQILSDEKDLKSAYLFYLSNEINKEKGE